MLLPSDLQIIAWIGGLIIAANALAMILFVLFSKLPESSLKENIRNIILELDKFADNMENTEKRSIAVHKISEILGWRKLFIPSALIGWIIDLEVAAIRKMQKKTNAPN